MIYPLLLFVGVIWLPAYTVATQLITNENSVPHTYIVTVAKGFFKSDNDETTQEKIAQMIQGHGEVKQVFKYAMQGFSAILDDVGLQNILDNSDVIRVEEDESFKIDDNFDNIDFENLGQGQNRELKQSVPWGLDRIDGEDANLDGSYNPAFGNEGEGVTVYVLDTGILDTHEEFEGRAKQEFDANPRRPNEDCNMHPHGTHVAGIIGAKTYGVAKKVNLVGVNIFDCDEDTSVEVMIRAIEWVIQHASRHKPAAVNISVSGVWDTRQEQTTLTTAIENLVDSGFTTVVAAGNEQQDACNFSPGDIPSVITVGATAEDHGVDLFAAGYSNWGPCVDILAPGTSIVSTWIDNTTNATFALDNGTSQAAPHVCGAVALYLSEDVNLCPSAVTSKLLADSSGSQVEEMRFMTPKRMLYVGEYSYASDTYYMKSSHGTYIRIHNSNNGITNEYNVLLTDNKDDGTKIIIKYLGNDQYALRSATHYEGYLHVKFGGRDKSIVMREYMRVLPNNDKFYMTRLSDGRVTFRSVQWGNYMKANKRKDIVDTQRFVGNWEKFTIIPAYNCD